jgi:hypothetical protein
MLRALRVRAGRHVVSAAHHEIAIAKYTTPDARLMYLCRVRRHAIMPCFAVAVGAHDHRGPAWCDRLRTRLASPCPRRSIRDWCLGARCWPERVRGCARMCMHALRALRPLRSSEEEGTQCARAGEQLGWRRGGEGGWVGGWHGMSALMPSAACLSCTSTKTSYSP